MNGYWLFRITSTMIQLFSYSQSYTVEESRENTELEPISFLTSQNDVERPLMTIAIV